MKKLELLAPVGKMESLYAAVENGANAVYLGGKLFNARHYASNFSNEELLEAVNYAHLRRVRVYVTVNILIDESEMEEAINYIKYLYEIGVDGIIVQDLGLAYLVKKLIPNMEIHASTQMTINNAEGAEFLYSLGFTRVVLSRETPIEEIKKIHKRTPVELEVFIHGALCVSYSGQCLMSSMIGGRSGNRGTCAQPCRMPSSIVNEKGQEVDGWKNKHILSPKDLNTVEEIGSLIDAGVLSFKIEGRMKRPEYVATVVDVYRRAIDLGSSSISGEDMENIEQIFNRGFTKGATFKDFGRNFISYDRPNNRGIYLGKVVRSKRDRVEVRLESQLEEKDGVEFKLGGDDYKGMQSETSGRPGEIVEFKKIGNIREGDLVYKTSSFKLLEGARESYKKDTIKREISMELELKLNKRPKIKVTYGGVEVSESLENLVEASRTKPLEKTRVEDQLLKLGDTVYSIKDLKIDLDENIFMPISSLNKLRRMATEKLDQIILDSYLGPSLDNEKFKMDLEEVLNIKREKEFKKILSAKVEDINILKRLDLGSLTRIYLNFYDRSIYEALDYLKDKDLEVFVATEKILYSEDIARLKDFLDKNFSLIDGVAVSNLGTFKFVRDNYDLLIHGDMGLNIFNSYGLMLLEEEGLDSCNLSQELNLRQMEIINKKSKLAIGGVVYGYIPVMTTKHCPMSLVKGCKNDLSCGTCEFSKGYSIKDRVGAEFKMLRKTGFTSIYNSVPIMVLDDLDLIKRSGLDELRLDFTFEDENIEDVLSMYSACFKEVRSREDIKIFISDFKERQAITKGHFFRGIIE